MAFFTTLKHFLILLIILQPMTLLCQSAKINEARVLFIDHGYAKAKSILNSITKGQSDYPEALYYLGRIAVEEDEYDLSVDYFESAIEAKSDVPEYHNWLGVMYGVVAMSSNPVKQAYLAPKIKNEFEKSAALDPSNLQTQWGLISYYVKAPGFLGGSWEKAMACAKVISEQNRAQGVRAYAFLHAGQKKNDLAEKEFKEAITLEPDHFEHLLALGEFYEEQGKFDKAFTLYDENIKKYPANMAANFHLGKVSAHLAGLSQEKGIFCLNQYLNYRPKPNEPSHADASNVLGMIYEKKGETTKAKYCYETSLKSSPGSKEAKSNLARLNQNPDRN